MKLTDEELTRLVVENVIGWQLVPHQGRIDEELWILPANGAPLIDPMRFADFRALEEWKWAGLIVDKMRSDGWTSSITIDVDCVAAFGKTRYILWGRPSEAPRAITIAATLAVGAITEDQLS